jgi:hypothetical protein
MQDHSSSRLNKSPRLSRKSGIKERFVAYWKHRLDVDALPLDLRTNQDWEAIGSGSAPRIGK